MSAVEDEKMLPIWKLLTENTVGSKPRTAWNWSAFSVRGTNFSVTVMLEPFANEYGAVPEVVTWKIFAAAPKALLELSAARQASMEE